MKTATRKPRTTPKARTRTREWFWISVLALGIVGTVAYLHDRDRRETRAFIEGSNSRYESQMPPAEKEARRIAREEAERVVREHDR